jgi:hypothetical protein
LLVSLFLLESLFSSLILSFLLRIPSDTCTIDYYHLTIPPHFTLPLSGFEKETRLCANPPTATKSSVWTNWDEWGRWKPRSGCTTKVKHTPPRSNGYLKVLGPIPVIVLFPKKYFLVKMNEWIQKTSFSQMIFQFLCQKWLSKQYMAITWLPLFTVLRSPARHVCPVVLRAVPRQRPRRVPG